MYSDNIISHRPEKSTCTDIFLSLILFKKNAPSGRISFPSDKLVKADVKIVGDFYKCKNIRRAVSVFVIGHQTFLPTKHFGKLALCLFVKFS